MNYFAWAIALTTLFQTHGAVAGSCDPYENITQRIVEIYQNDPFLVALNVQMDIEMGTRRTHGHLASSIKENHNRKWFRGDDKVVIAIGEEMCDLNPSVDAFSIVVCHEVGHAIGGPPYYGGSGKKIDFNALLSSAQERDSVAASEGQSDYWATSHCMATLLEHENNEAWLEQHPVDATKYRTIIRDCKLAWGTDSQAAARCVRIAAASTELIQSMQKYGYQKAIEEDDKNIANGGMRRFGKKAREAGPYLPQPDEYEDRKAPSTLYNKYPAPQCRLDTYIAGAMCPIDFHAAIDHTAMSVNSKLAMKDGACLLEGANPKGARPDCWFNEARSIYGKPTIPGYTPPVKKPKPTPAPTAH